MKKVIVLAIIALFVAEAVAQVRPAGKKHYRKFYQSTTYVVKDRDPLSEYNKAIEEAMQRHWTITPFKMITFEEFERTRTNENASFMIYADIKQKNLDQVYEFINFVMGDKKREFERMPDLGSVPLSYRDANDVSYLYKMGAFVKFMQTQAKQDAKSPRMRLAMMNVRDQNLKNMELWVLESELAPDINSVEKIQRHYPHKVKIATREEIAAAIAQDRADVAFLHKIGPEDATRSGRGKCWKFIISAKDGTILYSSNHDVSRQNPDALLLSDLKEMAK